MTLCFEERAEVPIPRDWLKDAPTEELDMLEQLVVPVDGEDTLTIVCLPQPASAKTPRAKTLPKPMTIHRYFRTSVLGLLAVYLFF